jgi:probable O-glycosylation ligase (exosortase A-associated)
LRDIVLTAVFAALLLAVFKHPVIGAYLWAWFGLMNPQKMTYGFAYRLPFSQVIAIVTLIALALTTKRYKIPLSGVFVLQILLIVWMTITSPFAMAPAAEVLDRWIFVMKIHLMLFVTWALIADARQLRILVWVVALSVGFFGIKGGIWTVLTGGGGRVWGPPGGMLESNNALAVGLVMLVPIFYFLHQTEPNRWIKRALVLCMVTLAFSTLGSQSRGALLALLAMAFFLGLKGRYPARTSLGLLVLVALAIAFMPESWTNRMETIRSYQEDGSAMSRLWTWTTLWNAAVDRPLVGAGFVSDNPTVFGRYAPTDGEWGMFAGRVYVAHSIYFQMLGEHGFVGLGLFLAFGITAWVSAGRVARRAMPDAEYAAWMPLLMRMVQVSLIGYAVGGAFLSIAYLDLPFYIVGFVVLCDALLRRRAGERVAPQLATPVAGLRRGQAPGSGRVLPGAPRMRGPGQ